MLDPGCMFMDYAVMWLCVVMVFSLMVLLVVGAKGFCVDQIFNGSVQVCGFCYDSYLF